MRSPVAIRFNDINKQYGDQTVLSDINFTVEQGEFITILGTSGSGKTTLLKMVNRLIEPDRGSIEIMGELIEAADLISLRRNIGYVVQQIGLFPHMTIEENIQIVPKLLGWSSQQILERTRELMTLIQLPYEQYAHRYPNQLSGGQQQRVGVARGLAGNPPIMLFDEPFGAVDAITRYDLQKEIKQIHSQLGDKTFLFVTHDINEAFRLGDRVMIMDQGRISQFDSPQMIVQSPQSEYVKRLLATIYQEEQLWESLTC